VSHQENQHDNHQNGAIEGDEFALGETFGLHQRYGVDIETKDHGGARNDDKNESRNGDGNESDDESVSENENESGNGDGNESDGVNEIDDVENESVVAKRGDGEVGQMAVQTRAVQLRAS
jgi:hypothetical protein